MNPDSIQRLTSYCWYLRSPVLNVMISTVVAPGFKPVEEGFYVLIVSPRKYFFKSCFEFRDSFQIPFAPWVTFHIGIYHMDTSLSKC